MPGVYISYPFCAQKCTYCNFASGVFAGELEREYVEALVAEVAAATGRLESRLQAGLPAPLSGLVAHTPLCAASAVLPTLEFDEPPTKRSHECERGTPECVRHWPWRPDTVYLGGGTPSRIGARDLERILSSVPGRPWGEATIEVAPGGISREKVGEWLRAGLNRVSLGVQSFVPRELARTGRKHSAEIVASEIGILRDAGLTNINVDLIAGLPGQSVASWRESLAWIERLEPPHVSVYMLEVDEDSRLGNEILLNGKRYGAPEIPADELTADLYETAVEELRHMGIHRYEISNFARPGFESLHNLKYWRLEPYLGFGADAHSFDGTLRFQNVESPAEYVDRIRQGQSARLSSMPANHAEERFFVGLRLMEGVRPEPAEWTRFEAPIDRFLQQGLLEREGEKIRLTNRGVLLSNEVFAEFII